MGSFAAVFKTRRVPLWSSMRYDSRRRVKMSGALERYRRTVCEPNDHDHGEAGELDCLLETLHRLRSGGDPVAILNDTHDTL